MSMAAFPFVCGVETPLLDVIVNVSGEMLAKFGIERGSFTLSSDLCSELLHDLNLAAPRSLAEEEGNRNDSVVFTAGGSTLNTMRVLSWMNHASNAIFAGCIGNDSWGKEIEENCAKEGVIGIWKRVDAIATGKCLVLVHEKERCLITDLGASQCYLFEDFISEKSRNLWQTAQYFYSSGFLLALPNKNGLKIALEIGEFALKNERLNMTNLSAPFICNSFLQDLLDVLEYIDIVFGNEIECRAFGLALKLDSLSPENIGHYIAKLPKKGPKTRIVVITRGKDPTVVIADGKTDYFPVPNVPSEAIVDTNGAGDAFCGGFISKLILNEPLNECVRAGHYAASKIIQTTGLTLIGLADFSSFMK